MVIGDGDITATTLVLLPRQPGPATSDPIRSAVEISTTYPDTSSLPAMKIQELVRSLAITMHSEEARVVYRIPAHLPLQRFYTIDDLLEWIEARRRGEGELSSRDFVGFMMALPMKERLGLISRIIQSPDILRWDDDQ